MLAQLAAVIFQEIAFHAVLVQEVIAVVYNGFIPSVPYGCHGVIEGSLPCVFRMGVDVNAQRFMPGDFHRFRVTKARIIVQIEGQHVVLQLACPQCYGFAHLHGRNTFDWFEFAAKLRNENLQTPFSIK